jgi:septation ring formation regulator EzrA
MDGPLKELHKLEKLTENAQGKAPSIENSLDSLLQSLRDVKDRIDAGSVTEDTYVLLAQNVEAKKKELDEKQKEIYNGIARFGKALDKVCMFCMFCYY